MTNENNNKKRKHENITQDEDCSDEIKSIKEQLLDPTKQRVSEEKCVAAIKELPKSLKDEEFYFLLTYIGRLLSAHSNKKQKKSQ